MKLEVVRFTSLPEDRWGELLARATHRSIFYGSRWIKLWECAYFRARSWVILATDNQGIRAALPVVEFRRGLISNFYSLPYGTYGGPIYEPGEVDSALVLLETFASFQGFGERVVTDFYGECGSLPGFRVATLTSQILNLSQGLDKIWEGMSSAKRRLVHQAERFGVEVTPIRPEEIEICCRMDEETANYHNCRPKFDANFYKHLYAELSPVGMLCWLMARQDGEPLAHIINLCYEKELFYWQGGSFRSGLRYRPNDALIWHTIRWGSTQGFSVYNLGTSPTPGVAKFKAGWGAITLSYQAYHRDCRLLNFLRSFRRI